MYCTFCGKRIEDDSAFCVHCGKPVPQGSAPAKLVAAARAGDQEAIGILYEKTYSVGAAAAAGAAGGTGAGTGAAGAAAAGTAGTAAGAGGTTAAAGALGALKIGFITLAAAAVIGLGAFGAVQLVSSLSDAPSEPPAREDVFDRDESERPKRHEEPETPEESETPEEPSPIDEALEQYRTIIGQAESYEFEEDFVPTSYRYALVQMQPDDPVPTLLLGAYHYYDPKYVRFFQYDPDTKTVQQPVESVLDGSVPIGTGGYANRLDIAADGEGMICIYHSFGVPHEYTISRITLDGDSLSRDILWSGLFDDIPDSLARIGINWHEIGDLSALDDYVRQEAQTENENADLLAAYVGTYTCYERYHNFIGGGERLRDITLTESGRVTGGGTSWNITYINWMEPSEIIQNADGTIVITFDGMDDFYKIYPAGVVPMDTYFGNEYTVDSFQEGLDLSKVHVQYVDVNGADGGDFDILYHN